MSRFGRPITYWRLIGEIFHCYRHTRDPHGYITMCGRGPELRRIGGQMLRRPPCERRCGRCDVHEIELFKADGSLPESEGWRDQYEDP